MIKTGKKGDFEVNYKLNLYALNRRSIFTRYTIHMYKDNFFIILIGEHSYTIILTGEQVPRHGRTSALNIITLDWGILNAEKSVSNPLPFLPLPSAGKIELSTGHL